jgi:hypothetical protein
LINRRIVIPHGFLNTVGGHSLDPDSQTGAGQVQKGKRAPPPVLKFDKSFPFISKIKLDHVY